MRQNVNQGVGGARCEASVHRYSIDAFTGFVLGSWPPLEVGTPDNSPPQPAMEDVENGEQKWILSLLSNKGSPLLSTLAGAL